MSARILDGRAVAAAIRASVAARRARVHGGGGPSAGARHRAGRRGPGVGDLRPEQGPGRQRVRAVGRSAAAAGRPRRSTSCSALVARLNASASARRHPGAVAAARGDGHATPRSRCSTRSIRPRTSTASHPVNVGRLVQGRARPDAVHAVRRDRDAGAQRDRDRRRARGRDRPQRDRRQADGDAAAAARRDGDDLPLEDAGSRRRSRATADILVAAIGRPGFVTPAFVKPGATVIDVGINPVTDAAVVEQLFRAGLAAAAPTSSGADRSSSATCIRASRTSPAR